MSTAPAASAATSRSLSLTLSTSTRTAGATVSLSGRLTRSPKRSAVTIQLRTGSRWKTVKTARTTSSRGSWSTKLAAPKVAGTYAYRVTARKSSSLKAATSPARTVDVRRRTTLTLVAPSTTYAGISTTLSGTLAPSTSGRTITLQRSQSGSWRTLGTTTVGVAGTWTFDDAPSSTRKYRAVFAGVKGLAASVSSSRTVTAQPLPATPVVSTASPLPPATVGVPYSTTLTTIGQEDGQWDVADGSLPGGVTLDGSTGVLAGTPSTDGTYAVTVRFTRANGQVQGSKALTLTVTATAPVAPVIDVGPLPAGTVGSGYPATRLTTLGDQPGTWTSTPLPPGLQLSSSGLLTGTPTTDGTTTVTVTFAHANGLSAASSLLLQVDPAVPVNVPDADPVVSAGSHHTCRVTATHALSCWGDSIKEQLGDGPHSSLPQDQAAPVTIGTADWLTVSAGSWNTCGIQVDRSLWCWGFSGDHVLGRGTQIGDAGEPTKIPSDQHWATVELGASHACAITTASTLYCWGQPGSGRLGVTAPDTSVPRQVGTERGWTDVSAGGAHTCGIRDGALYCWGLNRLGQVGDGTVTDRTTPTPIGSATDWTSVSAGGGHTCAIRDTDDLYCWGSATTGQRGTGSVVPDATPYPTSTPTLVGSGWSSVSAGGKHTCGVSTAGDVRCWGSDAWAQLGDGDPAQQDLAAPPAAAVQGGPWSAVTTGEQHTCAVRTDGATLCWGANGEGALGIGGSLLDPTRWSRAAPTPTAS